MKRITLSLILLSALVQGANCARCLDCKPAQPPDAVPSLSATPSSGIVLSVRKVTTSQITLAWNIATTSDTRLDWKRDDGNDASWPYDFWNGGILHPLGDAQSFIFEALPATRYAFRIRIEATGEVSNIVHATVRPED